MPEWRAEIEGASIVLLGHSNPKIFQPPWFDHHGLIRAEEAESAENLVSLPELTTFTTAWLSIQVTPDRFQATTIDPAHFEALRDLVLGTFALLEHTPFDKMGMNREMHFKVLPEERYVEFGHFLVPKAPWRGVLTDPRTRSVTVQGFQTRGSEQIQLFVKVEPSVRIQFGVFVNTNEHYEFSGEGAGKRLMLALRNHWGEAQASAKRIAEHLLDQSY